MLMTQYLPSLQSGKHRWLLMGSRCLRRQKLGVVVGWLLCASGEHGCVDSLAEAGGLDSTEASVATSSVSSVDGMELFRRMWWSIESCRWRKWCCLGVRLIRIAKQHVQSKQWMDGLCVEQSQSWSSCCRPVFLFHSRPSPPNHATTTRGHPSLRYLINWTPCIFACSLPPQLRVAQQMHGAGPRPRLELHIIVG